VNTSKITVDILSVFIKIGENIINLFPYIIVGIVLGEALKLLPWTKTILTSVEKHKYSSVVFASLLGILSPLCTLGTVPVVLQLYGAGMPIAPLVSFLSSSSMLNPQIFIYTFGSLGCKMAIYRAIAVLMFSIILGLIIQYIPISKFINSNLNHHKDKYNEILLRRNKKFISKEFIKNSMKSFEFIILNLTIGILFAEAINVFIPTAFFNNFFPSDKWYSVLMASLAGIPFYACGGGNIPLIGALMDKGLSKSSAIAFFIAGSATRVTSIMAIGTVLKPLSIAFYVFFLMLYLMIAGNLFLLIFK
jgi:uncharacterized membrane protein YraQ (UPF0718 family)